MPPRIRLQIWNAWHMFFVNASPFLLRKQNQTNLRSGFTHDAILNAEAELELEVGSLDEDGGDGRAAHDAQLYLHLIL